MGSKTEKYVNLRNYVMNGSLGSLSALLLSGIDVNCTFENGTTSLGMLALVSYGDVEAAKIALLLLNYGAEIGIRDFNGINTLGYACKGGKLTLAQILIRRAHTSDISNQDNDGCCLLHYVIDRDDKEMLYFLMSYLSERNICLSNLRDNNGLTPWNLRKHDQRLEYHALHNLRGIIQQLKPKRNGGQNHFSEKIVDCKMKKLQPAVSMEVPTYQSVVPSFVKRAEGNEIPCSLPRHLLNTGNERGHDRPMPLGKHNKSMHQSDISYLFSLSQIHLSQTYRCGAWPKPEKLTTKEHSSEVSKTRLSKRKQSIPSIQHGSRQRSLSIAYSSHLCSRIKHSISSKEEIRYLCGTESIAVKTRRRSMAPTNLFHENDSQTVGFPSKVKPHRSKSFLDVVSEDNN